ncbi:esterase [Candidatus Pelagibacter bacterium]|nr:esterase [Candidatus Pelagibacter bacterium]
MLKYKLKLKDVKLEDFRVYLLALFKGILPKKKIKNTEDLKLFIQRKSAWVSQVTLYNYLKTRMGTKWVLHFDDEKFLASINKAKWNIYSIALQDLIFYSLSYLNVFYNYKKTDEANNIYEEILNSEAVNGMPEEIIWGAKEKFTERLKKIDWNTYYKSWPFNESALALYEWAPIADELKNLDRKIVLNSMILKWDNIKDEFAKLIKI